MSIGGGLFLNGRYRLLDQLGEGGMAVVWRARDLVLGRDVAVKLMATLRFGDRIRQEALAAAALSHPNIAQVYDYGETEHDGRLLRYVVMELVPGGTLAQRLTAGPLPPRFAMRVGAEIAAALAAAHGEGLVHRDIKPGNVILGPTGAKVVDFGIAAAVAPEGTGSPDTEVLGTPAYLAPERLFGAAVAPPADVYALGVLLHLAFTGHTPWTAENTRQMLEAHVYVEPAPLPPVPGVPGHVVRLCDRCLAKDPAVRPSAREVAGVLAVAAGLRMITDELPVAAAGVPPVPEPTLLVRPPQGTQQLPAAVPAPAPAPGPVPAALPAPVPASKPRRPLVVAAGVVVAVLAAGGWLLFPDRDGGGVTGAATRGTSGPSAAPVPPAPSQEPGAAGPASAAVQAGRTERSAPAPAATAGTTTSPVPTTPGATPATPPPATPTTPTPPATQPTTATPVQRTLTTSAGTVKASCPSPGTAQVLSWTAARTYKVQSADEEPGPAPAVVFKHGSAQVTVTVTCAGSEPSASES